MRPDGAGNGLTCRSAPAGMAGRGLAQPRACGRWLPVRLPETSLAALTFECGKPIRAPDAGPIRGPQPDRPDRPAPDDGSRRPDFRTGEDTTSTRHEPVAARPDQLTPITKLAVATATAALQRSGLRSALCGVRLTCRGKYPLMPNRGRCAGASLPIPQWRSDWFAVSEWRGIATSRPVNAKWPGCAEIGQVAFLAVTDTELALRSMKLRWLVGDVILRIPRTQVKSAELGSDSLLFPLTTTFGDGGAWQLETGHRHPPEAVVRGLNG